MSRSSKPIDPQVFKQVYEYDSETGDLIKRKTGKRLTGKGGPNGKYRVVRVNGKLYYQHRIIWAMAYDEDPGDRVIDHIDHDGHNNRLSNLRCVDQGVNMQNKMKRERVKGWKLSFGRYTAQMKIKGKYVYLGSYATAEEAHEAYDKKARELFALQLDERSNEE